MFIASLGQRLRIHGTQTCQRWKRDSPRAQFDPPASLEARFQRLFTWAI
jgi:hypothetical protein